MSAAGPPPNPGGATPPRSGPAGAKPGGAPGTVPSSPAPHRTSWTAYIKPVLWSLALLYVILFVFLNRATVEINFIFFTAFVPLIFVLVGVAIIGAVLSLAVGYFTRRRDAKKAQAAAAGGRRP